jgi:outer membrane protein assembly factor BamB
LAWSVSEAGVAYSLSAAKGVLYSPALLSGTSGFLTAWRDDGDHATQLWTTDVGYDKYGLGKPAIANGYVYINGKAKPWTGVFAVHALDTGTGSIVWTGTFGGNSMDSSPVIANNRVRPVSCGCPKECGCREGGILLM